MPDRDEDSTFDFSEAGYEAPADWARLRDLVPKTVTAKELRTLEDGGDKKGDLLALLKRHGVEPEPYDAKAAAKRNAP